MRFWIERRSRWSVPVFRPDGDPLEDLGQVHRPEVAAEAHGRLAGRRLRRGPRTGPRRGSRASSRARGAGRGSASGRAAPRAGAACAPGGTRPPRACDRPSAVAGDAAGHDVVPALVAAAGHRDHVVEGELGGREAVAAVLAAVVVPGVDVGAGERHVGEGTFHTDVTEQAKHRRELHPDRDAADLPVVVRR